MASAANTPPLANSNRHAQSVEDAFVDVFRTADLAAMLLSLTSSDVDVNATSSTFHTALQVVTHHCSEAAALLLLEHGADVNLSRGNVFPLHIACAVNRPAMVDLLLKRGADHQILTSGVGGTAMRIAAARNSQLIVLLLALHGADVNAVAPSDGATPLHVACRKGHLDTARLLLHLGADIGAVTHDGDTLLHTVCSRGYLALAHFLIENGADVNEPSGDFRETPLVAACAKGHAAMALLLVSYGANTVQACPLGTIADVACLSGSVATALALSEAGVVFNGERCMMFACHSGRAEMVNFLSSKFIGYDIRAARSDNEGALLHIACGQVAEFSPEHGLSLARLLHALGADPEWMDQDGWCPIHECKSALVLQQLLDFGIEVDTPRDWDGVTALFGAAQYGFDDLTALLLSRRADVTLQTVNGSTPLHAACVGGNLNAARILHRHCANRVRDVSRPRESSSLQQPKRSQPRAEKDYFM